MPEEAPVPIRKLLVANRSEIAIRVFRSAHELGIRTVAIYSHEDRYALHRFKADEAYRIGKPGEPLRAYLDIDGIITLARQHAIDAIHPGYGFLSENAHFARACQEAGIAFIGPQPEILAKLGDKVVARHIAREAGVPILPGTETAVASQAEAGALARKLGYPLIVKAAMGGGGRGMRVALTAEALDDALDQARREAGAAFGIPDIFLERYVASARHIEVQLLGDRQGHLVHLYERDCSLQRRHQKMVEIAPALNLDPGVRQRILDAALAVGQAVGLDNAGTVEFLLDAETGDFYFIEVNPRIQVEHTVTEAITGFDLVKSQILIAQGKPLSSPEIGITAQDAITTRGFALQCRVTTEDPTNNFLPDYGRLSHYRSASGMGIRLDAGTAFSGAVITPFYDSLLVKVTALGLRFHDAARRMERCLQEFRVRGVKTNIPFLINLIMHPKFLLGGCTTRFIDETPKLFHLAARRDRATKLLSYIAEIIVNGNPEIVSRQQQGNTTWGDIARTLVSVPAIIPSTMHTLPSPRQTQLDTAGEVGHAASVPQPGTLAAYPTKGFTEMQPTEKKKSSAAPTSAGENGPTRQSPWLSNTGVWRGEGAIPAGTRDKFLELGPEPFAAWLLEQKSLQITDTTFRDAHQSLLATRMRTYDMVQIAPYYAMHLAGLFSLEMWGGATFDTSMRFLKESPWERLAELRKRVPNILFQMLLRAANAVGYTNYPDNVVRAFVKESADAGIDLFRIFDAMNWLPNLKPAIQAVRDNGKLCEAALCYTGDISDFRRSKYNLKYYVELAKELEKLGANILAIKDMAGLCKPYAARQLVRALKQEIGLPIHFHTHDSSGGQMAALLFAAEEGVDVVDAAMAPLAGMTSQPSLNTLAEILRNTERDTGLSYDALQPVADYWEAVRCYYRPFESTQIAASAEVYQHEMPGGQYTNLLEQARALGLETRWQEARRMYAEVNLLFGDIVKVTPTSKVVGDMALFMVANNLTAEEVLHSNRELAFPESVVEFFEGRLGQPPGGFPKELQKRVLRGRKPMRGRPGASLPAADFAATRRQLEKQLQRPVDDRDVVTHLLYPRVFPEFAAHQQKYSDTSVLPTPLFFYGMEPGEEVSVDIERGKTLIIRFLTVGDAAPDGGRLVFFELNGQPREVRVLDRSLAAQVKRRPKAEAGNPCEVGAPMPGLVASVLVTAGEHVAPGQKLFTLEAMKMETTIYANCAGTVGELFVTPGTQVEAGDLLLRVFASGA